MFLTAIIFLRRYPLNMSYLTLDRDHDLKLIISSNNTQSIILLFCLSPDSSFSPFYHNDINEYWRTDDGGQYADRQFGWRENRARHDIRKHQYGSAEQCRSRYHKTVVCRKRHP